MRSVTCIPTEKARQARRDLNVSDAVFLPFSDGENHLSIGSMVQKYKSDSEKRPGRSVSRESCWSVGSLKLIKIIIPIRQALFCPPTSLEC